MELLEDFSDERPKMYCIHGGVLLSSRKANRDHVPSRCLLDRPLPDNPPKVTVCAKCNSSFARDEEYVSVLLAAVISGDAVPDPSKFPKAAKSVRRRPKLHARIAKARREQGTLFGEPEVLWAAEAERVERVIVKNARGHLFHELGEASTASPTSVWFFPAIRFSRDQRDAFERVDPGPLLPEVGSRMMSRVVLGLAPLKNGWVEVQPDVYRYAVMQHDDGVSVRTLMRNYLATEVIWESD